MAYVVYLLLFIFSVTSLYNTLMFRLDVASGMTGYIVVLCLLLIECLSIYVIITNVKSILASKINLLIFLWMIYSVVIMFFTSDSLFDDIRSAIWWPSVYFVFYQIARTDYTGKRIKVLIYKFMPILFLATLIMYFSLRRIEIEDLKADNSIFYLLLLLPFVCLLSKKIKYIFLIIAVMATFYSFKRSAVLYTSIIVLVSIYFDFWYHKKMSFLTTLVVPLVLIWGILLGVQYLDSSTEGYLWTRFANISEDQGSGRISIWKDVLSMYDKKSWEIKVLGSGFNAVNRDFSLSAHNDIIEMLYDFGIWGMFIYGLYIIRLIIGVFQSKVLGDNYLQANVVMLVIFFIMSMVSHLWLYPSFYAYLIMLVGITNGQMHRLVRNQECSNTVQC